MLDGKSVWLTEEDEELALKCEKLISYQAYVRQSAREEIVH